MSAQAVLFSVYYTMCLALQVRARAWKHGAVTSCKVVRMASEAHVRGVFQVPQWDSVDSNGMRVTASRHSHARRKRNRSHTIRHRLREQVLRAISQLALLPLLEQQGKLFAALAARPEKSGTSGADESNTHHEDTVGVRASASGSTATTRRAVVHMAQAVLGQLRAGLPSAAIDLPGSSCSTTAGFGDRSEAPMPPGSAGGLSDGFPRQAGGHASPAARPRARAASFAGSAAGTEEAESAMADFCVQGDEVHALAQHLANLLCKVTHLPGKSTGAASAELPLPLPGPHTVLSGILLMAWPWDKRQAEGRAALAELCPAPASALPAADAVATRGSKQRAAPAPAAAAGSAEDQPAGMLPENTSASSARASDPRVAHAESSHVGEFEYDVASSIVAALSVGVLTGQGNSDPACLLSRGTLVDRFYSLVAYALSALSEAMAVLGDPAMFQMLMASAAGVVSNFAGLDKRMGIMPRPASPARPTRAAAGWTRGRASSIDTSECSAQTARRPAQGPAEQPRPPRLLHDLQPSAAAARMPPMMYTGAMLDARQMGYGPMPGQPSSMRWHPSTPVQVPRPPAAPQPAPEPMPGRFGYAAPYVPGAMHPMAAHQYMHAWAMHPARGMGQPGSSSATPMEPGWQALPRALDATGGTAAHTDAASATYRPGMFVHHSSAASMPGAFSAPCSPWWQHQAAAYGGRHAGPAPMAPLPYSTPPPAAKPGAARKK